MRKSLRASVLILALACSALAGEIPTPPAPQPPPQSAQEATTDGTMDTPLLVQIALNLLALL